MFDDTNKDNEPINLGPTQGSSDENQSSDQGTQQPEHQQVVSEHDQQAEQASVQQTANQQLDQMQKDVEQVAVQPKVQEESEAPAMQQTQQEEQQEVVQNPVQEESEAPAMQQTQQPDQQAPVQDQIQPEIQPAQMESVQTPEPTQTPEQAQTQEAPAQEQQTVPAEQPETQEAAQPGEQTPETQEAAQPGEQTPETQEAAQPGEQTPENQPVAEPSTAQKVIEKAKETVKDEVKGKAKEEATTAIKEKIIKKEAARNKKLLYGCLSSIGCGTILLLALIFIFVGQSAEQTANFAQFIGIDQGSLINTLILIVNFFFGTCALTAFILSVVGLFKSFSVKKDDKEGRKKGIILAVTSFVVFVLLIIVWFTAWNYLNSKAVPTTQRPVGLVTEPAVTTNLTAPIDITFDASNLPYESNYEIISYYWDFGDGQQGAGSSIEKHTYERKGSGRYEMTLTLTFRNTKTGEETQQSLTHIITIADEKVMASFISEPTEGAAPLIVTFDASESADPDGEISSYAWDFDGTGFTEGEITEEFTYNQVGSYTARLRVTNPKGDFDIAEQEINVTSSLEPQAVITLNPETDGNFYVGNSYSFEASKSTSPSGNITDYEWDFGDGTAKVSTRTANHSFKEAGKYEIILKIQDEDGLEDEVTELIDVLVEPSAPKPIIKTVPEKEDEDDISIQGSVPFEVTFDASSSTDPDDDIVDYQWDFDGDGEYDSAGETVSNIYNEPGNYIVSLVATDATGNEGISTFTIKVASAGLQSVVTASPTSGVVPLIVEFDASGSTYSDGDIVSYEWDFGDGSGKRQDVAEVTYKYTKIGTFETQVTVKTSDGKQETESIIITVRPVALTACFEPSKLVGDAPLVVNFNSQCSTGTITKYRWDFGDGEVSTEHRPSHTYEQPGSYEVVLEVTDPQNVVNTTSEFITVTGEISSE